MLEMPSKEQKFTSRVNFVLTCHRQRNARPVLAVEIAMGLQMNFQREQSIPPHLARLLSPEATSLG